jgi:hypothetical protein
MKFPEHLDEEDMELFRKEARLAGWVVTPVSAAGSETPNGRVGVIFDEGRRREGYVKAAMGLWVKASPAFYSWATATDYVDEYELKHQDSSTDTST